MHERLSIRLLCLLEPNVQLFHSLRQLLHLLLHIVVLNPQTLNVNAGRRTHVALDVVNGIRRALRLLIKSHEHLGKSIYHSTLLQVLSILFLLRVGGLGWGGMLERVSGGTK